MGPKDTAGRIKTGFPGPSSLLGGVCESPELKTTSPRLAAGE